MFLRNDLAIGDVEAVDACIHTTKRIYFLEVILSLYKGATIALCVSRNWSSFCPIEV